MNEYSDVEIDENIYNIEYYMDMAESAEFDSNYDKALEYYSKCLECPDEEDSIFYSHYEAYSNICRIFKEKKEYNKALCCLNEMMNRYTITTDKKAENFHMYGCIYKEMKKYEDAEKSYLEAIRYWKETIECDKYISEKYCFNKIAYCKFMLGSIFIERNDFESAESCLKESVNLYEKVKENDEYMIENETGLYKAIGDLFIRKNDFVNAYDYYIREADLLMSSYIGENDKKCVEMCSDFLQKLDEVHAINTSIQDNDGTVSILKDLADMKINLCIIIGNAYCKNELNVKEGLKYYNKGLSLAEEKYGIASYITSKFYKCIGETYAYKLNDSYDLGMSYMKKCNFRLMADNESLEFKENINKQFEIYKEAGECYERVEKYNEAVQCFKNSLVNVKDSIMKNIEKNNTFSEITYYDYIAVNDSIVRNYTFLGQYQCAIEYEKDNLEIMLNCVEKEGYYISVSELTRKYIDIGQLYLKEENYEQSEQYYSYALKYCKESEEENIDSIIDIYSMFINLYEVKGDIKSKAFYEKKLKSIVDDEIEF